MTFENVKEYIRADNIQKVSHFLNEGGSDVDPYVEIVLEDILRYSDSTGKPIMALPSLLQVAAMRGQKDIAEMLIFRGADVNFADLRGWTPLHYASIHNKTEIIELLLRNKANPNKFDDDDRRTPLNYYLSNPNPSIDIVKLFLEHKADPRLADQYGYKPANYISDEAIKELLEEAENKLNAQDLEKKIKSQ